MSERVSWLTSVILNPRGHLPSPNIIKESDILSQDGLEVPLPDPLCITFTGVYPYVHECIRARENSEA